ncbi:MAG: BtaA family protein [Planctomycetota bacterium]
MEKADCPTRGVYRRWLRPELSPFARAYWDRRIEFFDGRGWRPSFYFRGTTGIFARLVNWYIDRVANLRGPVDDVLAAKSVEDQRRIYDDQLRDVFWKRTLRAAIRRDTTLSLLGVPRPQRRQVERDYVGGIAKFVEDSVEAVFRELPLADNYFWRVYLTGQYTRQCCPEYLREDNFRKLKGGLVDRVTPCTATIREFLARFEGPIHRFVLLDHMDWMASACHPELVREWEAILAKAAPGARLLWRSGGLAVDYVDPLELEYRGSRVRVGELLRYDRPLAARLHRKDRVHTYGSFSIADLVAL